MTLVILPRPDPNNPNDPDLRLEAQVKLQTVIDDVRSVALIVYGEGPEIDRALEVAVGRAAADLDGIRRVVWCPDESVLSPEQVAAYTVANRVAVSIGLADRVAESLTKARAQLGFYVERAFLKAETQGAN